MMNLVRRRFRLIGELRSSKIRLEMNLMAQAKQIRCQRSSRMGTKQASVMNRFSRHLHDFHAPSKRPTQTCYKVAASFAMSIQAPTTMTMMKLTRDWQSNCSHTLLAVWLLVEHQGCNQRRIRQTAKTIPASAMDTFAAANTGSRLLVAFFSLSLPPLAHVRVVGQSFDCSLFVWLHQFRSARVEFARLAIDSDFSIE